MSEPFLHYAHMDDESDRSSLSFTGTESHGGYYALERSSYFHPVYQASHTASTLSHTASTLSHELRDSVLPPNNWPADTPIQAHSTATAAQFNSSPFPLLPTLRAVPIPFHASGNSSPHSASSGAISQHDPRTVTMPTLIGHAQYGGGLIDAHRCHYEPSFGFPNNNCMVEYSRAIPSPSISMPIVPTIFAAGVSSHSDSIFASGPVLRRSSRHPTSTFGDLPPSNSPPNFTPSGSFDSESYSSPSPPFSVGNHSPVTSRSDTSSDQIQPQPIITPSFDQLYTLTVPLEDVEFPFMPSIGEMSFFRCRWGNCRIWITSDKDAVKGHLTRTHNVVLRNLSDPARCEWVGCSSSTQRSGLVRHFHTHLALKWLCAVCKGAYTRQDSVASHARRESQCQPAHAISHPSAVAYRARINGNNTVTLTKIIQS